MQKAKISEIVTISKASAKFCGWPTITRGNDGELLLVYNGGREAHACPYGQIHLMRSKDDGHTWAGPFILADGPLDDRDGGVLVTQQGTILVNWFTSLAWLHYTRQYLEKDISEEERQLYLEWERMGSKLPPETISRELGHWIIRSEDNGATWSAKIPSVANSPHGPIQLADGRLLFAGRKARAFVEDYDMTEQMPATHPHAAEIGVAESLDDGKTWHWLSTIPPIDGHDAQQYHELHAVECADGRIIAQIRNQNDLYQGEVLQTDSLDGGKTWSKPGTTGIWGYPSHLLRLADDRLLVSYGHRRNPWGNQVRISSDNGKTWSNEIILLGEGDARDLGYPATVQLNERELLTVWYERLTPYVKNVFYEQTNPSGYAVIRMARWEIPTI